MFTMQIRILLQTYLSKPKAIDTSFLQTVVEINFPLRALSSALKVEVVGNKSINSDSDILPA